LQYFSKKKLVLPQGYFVNSSQIPFAKEVNKLLANCGCETFPIKPLSEAIHSSNFFFTIQNEIKNKLLFIATAWSGQLMLAIDDHVKAVILPIP